MYLIYKGLSFVLLAGVLFGCSKFNRLLHKSGTEFTVKVSTDVEDKAPIIEKAVRSLESKMSALRIDGDVARLDGSPDILKVKIFGDQPLEPVRETLFTTYQLELRPVAVGPISYATEEQAKAAAKGDQEVLPGKELGQPAFYVLEKEAVINGDDLRNAYASEIGAGSAPRYQIMFSLKPTSAEKFGIWTGSHIGNYLGIVLNKEVQSAPVIKGRITDTGTIEGSFTKQQAEDIALDLKSGYLPATLTVTDEEHFGN